MLLVRQIHPLWIIAAGLLGLCSIRIAERYQLPIVPTNDFARGLCVGVCIGIEILGGIVLVKAKVRSSNKV